MSIQNDFRQRLAQVLSAPTAPFTEGCVHTVLRAAVSASPNLRDRVDAHGNLEVVYGPGRPRLLFACHTDHPALRSNGDGTATVVGGVRAEHLPGARLRTFDGERFTISRVVKKGPPAIVRLRRARPSKGTALIFDLPDLRLGGGRIRSRVIDDLCAVAACLTTADRLKKTRWKGTVGFLFTRAEEVGFAGALGWVRTTRYPRSTVIVNLEMSSALRHTPQGSGPILRVGDRITTFDQEVSLGLVDTANALKIPYQRALMDGGACEATVYGHAGFRAGALCLPLKNYHNHGPRKSIAMEYVHEDDAENLVRWMVGYAKRFGRTRGLDARLEKLWRRHRRMLERSADEGAGK